MILTVGELLDKLQTYPPNLSLRIQTQQGELEGVYRINLIAGRVVLQSPMDGRKRT